ncbi:MAG: glycosyltransferase [Candidatus Hydrogenedentes bacterium]|nr:glycosyltransferase [Candidatus Hydrogenedentota bacterium]
MNMITETPVQETPLFRMQRPFRVLMTTDTLSGVWTYCTELIQALRPEVEVVLATMGRPLSNEQWAAVDRLGIEVQESTFKLEWMEDPWQEVEQAGLWLLELERKPQPQVVHLNQFVFGALPWQCPALVAGHCCVYSWWRAVHKSDPPPQWGNYRRRVREGLQSAAHVVAPSCAMLADLQRLYGPLQRTSVVYNGCSPGPFMARRKEFFVLCAARLRDAAKNAELLAEAAPGLPWPVYLAGDSEQATDPAFVPPATRMLGRLSPPALAHWMSRAAIYAVPAKYEPFGLSILEAALSGCTLVLGDIPSLREIWADAAMYVPLDDAVELREALKYLMKEETVCKRLGRHARHRASAFSANAMAYHYQSLYRQLARAHAAA